MTGIVSSGQTPAQLLNAVTASVHPHIQQLLDPAITYQQLQDAVIPKLSHSLTALLATCEQSMAEHAPLVSSHNDPTAAAAAASIPSLPFSPSSSSPLSPTLDWVAAQTSLSSTVESLHAAVLRRDVELSVMLYFQLDECHTLLTLLGQQPQYSSDAQHADKQRLLSFLSCWQQAPTADIAFPTASSIAAAAGEGEQPIPGSLPSPTADADRTVFPRAASIIRDARVLLTSHFLTVLEAIESSTERDGQSDGVDKRASDSNLPDVLSVFDVLSHFMPIDVLSAHFTSFVWRRYELNHRPTLVASQLNSDLSTVWRTYTAAVISAFHQQLPLVTAVLLPLLTVDKLPAYLHTTFVAPVVDNCSALLSAHSHSFEAYSFVLPHLSHVTSFLSTLSSTFLSLPLIATTLPPPPSPASLVSVVTAAFDAVPAVSAGTLNVSSQLVWSDCGRLLQLCDDTVALIAAVSGGRDRQHQPQQAQVNTIAQLMGEKLLNCLRVRRRQTTKMATRSEEEEAADEEPGVREVLIDLSSLALTLARWSHYQTTLLPYLDANNTSSTAASTAPSVSHSTHPPTSTTFSTDLHRLLSPNPFSFTVPATHNNKLQPLSPLNRSVAGVVAAKAASDEAAERRRRWRTVEDELRIALEDKRRAIESLLIDALHTVGQSFDTVEWCKKRDLPASLVPPLTAPSACIQHLSFFLSSMHHQVSTVLPAGTVRDGLFGWVLHHASLMVLSLFASTCPSRWWSKQYRLDLVSAVLTLREWRKETSEEAAASSVVGDGKAEGEQTSGAREEKTVDAVCAWLVAMLGLLECDPQLLTTLLFHPFPTTDTDVRLSLTAAVAVHCPTLWKASTLPANRRGALEETKGWTEIRWRAVWSADGGLTGVEWQRLVSGARLVRAREALGVAEGIEVWLGKRWDMQMSDYPALTDEQQSGADGLRAALQKWSGSGSGSVSSSSRPTSAESGSAIR